MLKTVLLFISYIFIFGKKLKVGLFKSGKGETFVGYLLLKFRVINFLQLYLRFAPSRFILITGTNGKTSTTALLNHILSSSGYKVLSNSTGSNLKRGLLSSLVINFPKYYKGDYNYTVFEVDEAVVPSLLRDLPSDYLSLSILILNLSRDQLDRYGEVDILASSINKALAKFPAYSLIISKKTFPELFDNKIYVDSYSKHLYSKLNNKLSLSDYYLEENLKYITKVLCVDNVTLKLDNIGPFLQVSGRGRVFKYKDLNVQVYLTKNPASFNANLLNLQHTEFDNIAIYVNDYIPDGRDVSWFYDIDYNLVKSALGSKNVYVLGSRSYDFYNFLHLLGVDTFNFLCLEDLLKYNNLLNQNHLVVLSNYSATQQSIKFLEK